jgi:hypothetical protein
MKKLVFILVVLVTNSLYSQINFDTLFVINVESSVDSDQYLLKIDNGTEYTSNIKHSVGDVFGYYDTIAKNFIPKWEYENSLFNKLYFSEHLWTYDSKPVIVVSINTIIDSEYRYEIVTDKGITYNCNYPPNVGDVVFHINSYGELINVVNPFKLR